MNLFSFKKLTVWKKSRHLSVLVYKLTKHFPVDERYGLINKMRRCTTSIVSNISEGTAIHSSKDKARFTEIAFCSALELLNQIILLDDLELISKENNWQQEKISQKLLP